MCVCAFVVVRIYTLKTCNIFHVNVIWLRVGQNLYFTSNENMMRFEIFMDYRHITVRQESDFVGHHRSKLDFMDVVSRPDNNFAGTCHRVVWIWFSLRGKRTEVSSLLGLFFSDFLLQKERYEIMFVQCKMFYSVARKIEHSADENKTVFIWQWKEQWSAISPVSKLVTSTEEKLAVDLSKIWRSRLTCQVIKKLITLLLHRYRLDMFI